MIRLEQFLICIEITTSCNSIFGTNIMRNAMPLLILVGLLLVSVVAQQPQPRRAVPAGAGGPPAGYIGGAGPAAVGFGGMTSGGNAIAEDVTASYHVQLTEFRMKSSIDPKLKGEDILKAFHQADGSKIEVVNTLRFTVLERNELSATFGKTVGVPSSENIGPGGAKMRSWTMQPMGTDVKIYLLPHEGELLMRLTYNVTRMEPNPDNDALVHESSHFVIQANELLSLGKPLLVGGSANDETVYLMVTVTD